MSAAEQLDELPQMRTVKEASQQLGISVSTIWKLIRQGKLKPYKVGGLGVTRLKDEDLRGLIEEK